MKRIPLTQGLETLVDDEDYERLMLFKWHAVIGGWGYYARTYSRGRQIYMHRLLLDIVDKPDVEGDHRDRDSLNNQKHNLRIVTPTQNRLNQKVRSDSGTGVRGVSYHKVSGLYHARIKLNYEYVYSEYFRTLEEATSAVQAARKRLLPND